MYHTLCRCLHRVRGPVRGHVVTSHVPATLSVVPTAGIATSRVLSRKRSRQYRDEEQDPFPEAQEEHVPFDWPPRRGRMGRDHDHVRDLLQSIEPTGKMGNAPAWTREKHLRSKYLRDQDSYEQALDALDALNDDALWSNDDLVASHARSGRRRKPSPSRSPAKDQPTLSFSNRRRPPPSKPIPLADLLESWQASENILGKAMSVGLSKDNANTVLKAFSSSLRSPASGIPPTTHPRDVAAMHTKLNHMWIQFLAKYVPTDQKPLFTALCESADLRHPKEWYPGARLMKRQIILHVGPTNSGKTHGALAELAHAPSGVYCGPLRLLAHEIHDRFRARGVACSLVTGEERRVDPLAKVTACTVEMVDLAREYDVGVIDEIQVIGDGQRGWAWTQALLGLRAKRIYVCGEESAVPLVERLLEGTGDELVVKRFDRLTPLKVSQGVVSGKLQGVQPGDCVVAFSRKEVFAYKIMIENANPGLKCAVVYGALPPETRAEQARLFNNHRETGYGVMVATDAVGMGLNLAINRVIFTSTRKWDGVSESPLSISALKQIGGRAGRYGLAHAAPYGTVTAFRERDLRYIQQTFPQSPANLTSAGLQPTPDMIEAFAHQLPHEPLTGLLDKFAALARLNGELYFLCNLDDQRTLAKCIENIAGMTMREQYLFVLAPVNTRSETALSVFTRVADKFARKQPLPLMSLLLSGVPPAKPAGATPAARHAAPQRVDWRPAFTEAVVHGIKVASKSRPDVKDARAGHVLDELYATAMREASARAGGLDEWRASDVFAPARSRDQLALLESVHRAILLYMWLANRFEGHATFLATPKEQAEWLLRECERAINLGLKVITESDYAKAKGEAHVGSREVGFAPSSTLRWGVASTLAPTAGVIETEEARVVIEEV